MNNFKDKLVATSKKKKEQNEKEKIDLENKQFSEIFNYATNHLSWLNDNYKSELEAQSIKGFNYWHQPILGKPKMTTEEINFTPRSQKLLQATKRIAISFRHDEILLVHH